MGFDVGSGDSGIDIDTTTVLANALLIFFSVGLVFAGFEGALRTEVIPSETQYPKIQVCDGGQGSIAAAGLDHEQTFHPRYGWVGTPDRRFMIRATSTQDWDVYTHNSEGFRDTYNSGRRTAIVVGDSFTYGMLADDKSTFPYLLDRWNPGMSFRNYGIAAYGTAQELRVYKDAANRTEHDLVVLGYFYNDPKDNMGLDWHGEVVPAKPRYELRNGTLTLTHSPVKTEKGVDRSEGTIEGIRQFLTEHTATYPYLASRIGPMVSSIGNRSTPAGPEEGKVTRRLRITKALVGEMATVARTENADMLIVVFPPKQLADPSLRDGVFSRSYWDRQKEMLRAVERGNPNVHVLDLEPHLRERIERGEVMYDPHDGHLKERGYRVTAELAQRRLVRMGVLSDASVSTVPDNGTSTCEPRGGAS